MTNKESEREILRGFLNTSPPDALNSKGKSYITISPDREPEVCAVCGEPAVTSSAMAWLWAGLCEKHKSASIALSGGGPVSIITEKGQQYVANGGDQ